MSVLKLATQTSGRSFCLDHRLAAELRKLPAHQWPMISSDDRQGSSALVTANRKGYTSQPHFICFGARAYPGGTVCNRRPTSYPATTMTIIQGIAGFHPTPSLSPPDLCFSSFFAPKEGSGHRTGAKEVVYTDLVMQLDVHCPLAPTHIGLHQALRIQPRNFSSDTRYMLNPYSRD